MGNSIIAAIRAEFASAPGTDLHCRDVMERLNAKAAQSDTAQRYVDMQTVSGLLSWMRANGELTRTCTTRPVGYRYNPDFAPKRPRAGNGLKPASPPPKPSNPVRESMSRIAKAPQRLGTTWTPRFR